MAQAQTAIKSARTYLNDSLGQTWTDQILMGFLQEAHSELVQDLDLNQVGVLKQVTPTTLVPAGTIALPNQPANILEPISMMEKTPGDDPDFYQDMIKVNFLPEEDMDQVLLFWCWSQEIIQFIGATADREVILRYKGYLTTPQLLTDPLGVIYAERFIGPRIAALAYDSIGRDSKKLTQIAEENKNKLIKRNVLAEQTPVRRKGYRSAKILYPGENVTSLISVSGGTVSSRYSDNEIPSGVIDGVNVTFTIIHGPNPTSSLELVANGVTQIQGIDYNLVSLNIVFTPASFGGLGAPPINTILRAWYRY